MIKVTNEIKTYKEHAVSANEDSLYVTQSTSKHMVILEFKDIKISVDIRDLKAAIENATNVNRY